MHRVWWKYLFTQNCRPGTTVHYYCREPGEARIQLEIKAFGDFNGDGVEDVLLIKSDKVIAGTFFAIYSVFLTRLTPGGRLKQLEVDNKGNPKSN